MREVLIVHVEIILPHWVWIAVSLDLTTFFKCLSSVFKNGGRQLFSLNIFCPWVRVILRFFFSYNTFVPVALLIYWINLL